MTLTYLEKKQLNIEEIILKDNVVYLKKKRFDEFTGQEIEARYIYIKSNQLIREKAELQQRIDDIDNMLIAVLEKENELV